MRGEGEVEGEKAARARQARAVEQAGVRDASVETIKAESSGDIGYEIGSFVLTVNGPDGKPVQEHGRYIELLKRLTRSRPELAIPLYERFLSQLRAAGLRVEAGEFGADMQVELLNDGPVTLILERSA